MHLACRYHVQVLQGPEPVSTSPNVPIIQSINEAPDFIGRSRKIVFIHMLGHVSDQLVCLANIYLSSVFAG